MKFIAKVFLIIVAIPIMVLCVLSINIRFQFLSSGFWLNAFGSGGVYPKISMAIENRLISKVVAGGGKGSDVDTLSNLISPGSLRDFFEKNIDSVLFFANGKSPEITVFVPSPEKLGNFPQKMSLTDFLKEFNISGISGSDIRLISYFGFWSWVLTAVSFTLLILVLLLTYKVTGAGKHLVTSGMALTLSGILILAAYFAGNFTGRVLAENFTTSANIGTSLAAIIFPPVIQLVTKIWIWFGALSLFLGILLFFLKKPVYNGSK